jgi:hypothetical protein
MVTSLLTLTLLGTLGLLATTVLGHVTEPGPAFVRSHFMLALGSTFLLVMGHSFIMFFLIATGVELKGMASQGGWGDSFRRRIVTMKSRAFPAMTLALLMAIGNFILGGAAHTRAIPGWAHGAMAWLTLAVSGLALVREYQVLAANNRLIAEAASRTEDTRPEGVR